MKKTIVIIFIGTFLLISCNPKKDTQVETAKEYPTQILELQEVTVSAEYPATLEGEQIVEIRSKIEGYIEQVYIEEGAKVNKGELLFKIDANSYLQEVKSKNATVLAAEATLETAVIQSTRTAALVDKKIVNALELTSVKNIERIKRAELSQAKADLSAAKSNLAFTNIVSPIAGIVGRLPNKIGSLVNSTALEPLTTVANTRHIYAYFSLSQQELNSFLTQYEGNELKDKFRNMPEVSLITADSELYSRKGKLQTLSGVLNTSTGSANFKAVFPNPEGKLWSGASAIISIPTLYNATILVPKKAVFELQGRVFVFKVDAQNLVHTTEIKIRNTSTEKEYLVIEGLNHGDQIVTDGLGNLKDGMRIISKLSSSKN